MRHSLLFSAFLAITSLPASAETMRMGLITPPSHQWTVSAGELAARLDKASAGAITLQVHPSGSLGNEAQMMQQLQSGALDLAFLTVGEIAAREPDFGTLIAPCIARTPQEATAVLQSEAARALLPRLERHGLHGLGFGMAGMRQVVLRKDWAGGDFTGQKIRTLPIPQEMDFWTRLGAAPTPLPLPALFDAFANGQIDGMQIDYEGSFNSGYFRNAAEVLATDHMIFPMVAVVSARKWQAMTPQTQAMLQDELGTALAELHSAYARIDTDYRGRLTEAGAKVTDAHDRFCALPGVAAWHAEWAAKSPLLNALKEAAK